jgi:hypothetical protein
MASEETDRNPEKSSRTHFESDMVSFLLILSPSVSKTYQRSGEMVQEWPFDIHRLIWENQG